MKFIQQHNSQINSKYIKRGNGEPIRGDNETVEIQGEEARAELDALATEHGESLELQNNLSKTLAGKGALLQELVADLREQGLNPDVIMQTNLNLSGNTIRFGAPGPVADPLAKFRPQPRPEGLVTAEEAVEAETPEAEEPEVVQPAAESVAEVAVDNSPKGRAEATIEAMEPLDSAEAEVTGAGLLRALQGLGLSGAERNAINLLLGQEFDTNQFWKGDKVSLNKPENGSLEIRITRGGNDLGTFTFPEREGSAIQLGSKIEIASSN